MRPLFEDMARRLATHGFGVAATEPFWQFSNEQRATIEARLGSVNQLADDTQLEHLEQAANHLVVEDDVTQVSVMGFCIGGYYTLKAAALERFDRAVAFYGMLRTPEQWQGPGHRDPLATAADVCPTLAIFGGADPWTPPADIDALRQAWSGRDDCEIIVVDGAEHGFVHDPDRPAHRADDAAMLWDRTISWMS
jgi:carboxymethylenebutenolidase